MGDKTNPAILAEIARKTDELNERIMTAVMGEIASADNIGEVDDRMPVAFAAGLAVIIETWRTEAQERVDARKQGAKGAQTKAEYAAGLLAGVAVGLRDALGDRLAVLPERAPAAEIALPKAETEPPAFCLAPHPFMDESCELVLGHNGSHSKTGMGVWPKAPRLRGCAPELCGGSSYDACIPAVRTADRVHADEIATPGVDEQCRETAPTNGEVCLRIAGHEGPHTDLTMLWDRSELAHCAPPTLPAEIFAGQCIGIHEGERCMLPSTHTSRHTGTQGTHWEGGGVALNPVATMLAEVKAHEWKGYALTAAEALADNERRFELDSLRAAAKATGAFSGAALDALTGRDAGGMDEVGSPPFPGEPGYCHDCDAGGHTCKGCGAATHHDTPFACSDPMCVANEPSIVSADPVIPPPPIIVSAALAEDGIGAGVAPPEIVPPAYSPKSLGIRRLAWSELATPPALADALRPAHRSVSQLETYSGCGLKYRLQRYGETTDVPSWSLVGGLVIHEVIERMEAAGWDRKNSEVWPEVFEEVVTAHEASSGISRDLWIAADGGKENGDWWLVEGEKMSQNFRLWRKKMISDGWKITAVEYEIDTPADWVGVPVKGFLDLVMWHPETGTVLLPDIKSGRNRPQSRTQLDIYGRALDRLGVPGVDSGQILKIEAGYLMVRKGELIDRHDVMAEGLAEAEIAARLVTMDRAERAGVYLPNPSALCGSCGVRAGCPVGRPAAAEAPAPVAP